MLSCIVAFLVCAGLFNFCLADDVVPELELDLPSEDDPTKAAGSGTGADATEGQMQHPDNEGDRFEDGGLNFNADLFTGQFKYSIPIVLPKGRRGTAPGLVLGYSLSGGNGWCGVGWSLGLGAIHRDTRRGAPIKWDATGPLQEYDDSKGFVASFNGFTVALTNTSVPSAIPQVYLARVDHGKRLRFEYYATAEPYWHVTDKSGNQWIFGPTASSRLLNPKWTSAGAAQTYLWALTWASDANGNLIEYFYTKDAGNQLYPLEVYYNANWDAMHTFFVSFETETRTDQPFSFRSGFKQQTLKRLTRINVQTWDYQLLRQYDLTYVNSPSTGKSLLQNVRVIGSDGETTSALLPLTFSYQAQSGAFGPDEDWSTSAAFNSPPKLVKIFDADADGLPDVLHESGTQHKVAYNTGSGFVPGTFGPIQSQTGDLTSKWRQPTYSWQTQFSFARDPFTDALQDQVLEQITYVDMLDMNGDGAVDRVEADYASPYTFYRVQFNQRQRGLNGLGSHFQMGPLQSDLGGRAYTGVAGWTKRFDYRGDFPVLDHTNDVWYPQYGRMRLLDINGDGYVDRIMRSAQEQPTQWKVQFGNGTQFGTLKNWPGVTGMSITWALEDMEHETIYEDANMRMLSGQSSVYGSVAYDLFDLNGDGLPDRVAAKSDGKIHVQYNNGAGFEPADTQTWQTTTGAYLWTLSVNENNDPYGNLEAAYASRGMFDVNGDGLPDRIQAVNSPKRYLCEINTGSGFGPSIAMAPIWNGPAGNYQDKWMGVGGTSVSIIDMNGDGLNDRVLMRDSIDARSFIVQTNSGPVPDLLSTIENGRGGRIEVTYRPSTVYDNRDNDGRSMLPHPILTVAQVVVRDGLGGSSTNSYFYKGGLFDAPEREFSGFHIGVVTNAVGLVTSNFFHQSGGWNGTLLGEYADHGSVGKIGMPYRIEKWGNDGKLYRLTLNKVTEVDVDNKGSFFPAVVHSVQFDYEGAIDDIQPYRATAKGFHFDSLTGNLLTETNRGEVQNVNKSTHEIANSDVLGPVLYTHSVYNTALGTIKDKVESIKTTSDAAGVNRLREREFTYDSRGNMTSRRDWWDVIDDFTLAQTNIYDVYGNISETRDATGILTTYTYEYISQTYPETVTVDGIVQAQSQYDSLYRLSTTINPAGLATLTTYDVHSRPKQTWISAPNSPAVLKSEFGYQSGVTLAGVPNNFTSTTVNNGNAGTHVTYAYQDGLGRTVQTRVQSERMTGPGLRRYRVTNQRFDRAGRSEFVSLPIFSDGASFTPPSGALVGVFTGYDPIGRPSRITNNLILVFGTGDPVPGSSAGDGAQSPSGYQSIEYKDGSAIWVMIKTDPDGAARKSYNDPFGRVWKMTESVTSGTPPVIQHIHTLYGYDPLGNLIRITNHAGHITSIGYDSLGYKTNLIEVDHPTGADVGAWSYENDAAGRLRTQRDPNGNIVHFYYSAPMGKMSDKIVCWPNGSADAFVTYEYGVACIPGQVVYPGLLSCIHGASSSEYYSYDARGRVVEKTVTISTSLGEQNFVSTTTYDDADRTLLLTYPNGLGQVSHTYDEGGNLTSISVPSLPGTPVAYQALLYDEQGRVEKARFGTTVETDYSSYPNTRRLKEIKTTKLTVPAVVLQNLEYTYDKRSNIKGIADYVNPAASMSSIQYDELSRLVEYTRSGNVLGFGYDALGNVTQNGDLGPGQYNYADGHPHAVTSANGSLYSYDAAGNMINRNGQTLQYDRENRLLWIGAWSPTFYYGPTGQRVRKVSTNLVETIWVDNIYEREGSRVLLHINANGKRIASFAPDGTELYYYHDDHLGSSSLVTDGVAAGNVLQDYRYKAYGASYGAPAATPKITRRYTGQFLDDDTGLYYYNGRYYDPEIGRFVQADALLMSAVGSQGLNLYSYVLNNPFRLIDPSGHFPEESSSDDSFPIQNMWDWYMFHVEEQAFEAEIMDTYFGDGTAEMLAREEEAAMNLVYELNELTGVNDMFLNAPEAFDNGGWLAGIGYAAYGMFQFATLAEAGPEKFAAKAVVKNAPEIAAKVASKTGETGVQLNKIIGDQTADAIASRYQFALREVPFETVGGRRVADVLPIGVSKKIAIESKVGAQRLTGRNRQEIARDWWLVRQKQVDGVIWEFTPSPITGDVGPDPLLLETLERLKIGVRINQ